MMLTTGEIKRHEVEWC